MSLGRSLFPSLTRERQEQLGLLYYPPILGDGYSTDANGEFDALRLLNNPTEQKLYRRKQTALAEAVQQTIIISDFSLPGLYEFERHTAFLNFQFNFYQALLNEGYRIAVWQDTHSPHLFWLRDKDDLTRALNDDIPIVSSEEIKKYMAEVEGIPESRVDVFDYSRVRQLFTEVRKLFPVLAAQYAKIGAEDSSLFWPLEYGAVKVNDFTYLDPASVKQILLSWRNKSIPAFYIELGRDVNINQDYFEELCADHPETNVLLLNIDNPDHARLERILSTRRDWIVKYIRTTLASLAPYMWGKANFSQLEMLSINVEEDEGEELADELPRLLQNNARSLRRLDGLYSIFPFPRHFPVLSEVVFHLDNAEAIPHCISLFSDEHPHITKVSVQLDYLLSDAELGRIYSALERKENRIQSLTIECRTERGYDKNTVLLVMALMGTSKELTYLNLHLIGRRSQETVSIPTFVLPKLKTFEQRGDTLFQLTNFIAPIESVSEYCRDDSPRAESIGNLPVKEFLFPVIEQESKFIDTASQDSDSPLVEDSVSDNQYSLKIREFSMSSAEVVARINELKPEVVDTVEITLNDLTSAVQPPLDRPCAGVKHLAIQVDNTLDLNALSVLLKSVIRRRITKSVKFSGAAFTNAPASIDSMLASHCKEFNEIKRINLVDVKCSLSKTKAAIPHANVGLCEEHYQQTTKSENRAGNIVSTLSYTNRDPNQTHIVEELFRPKTRYGIDPRLYRLEVLQDLQMSKKKVELKSSIPHDLKIISPIPSSEAKSLPVISPIPTLTKDEFEHAAKKYEAEEKYFCADYELELNKNAWTALPSLRPTDCIERMRANNEVIISYSQTRRQYFAKLAGHAKEERKTVPFQYVLFSEERKRKWDCKKIDATVFQHLHFDEEKGELKADTGWEKQFAELKLAPAEEKIAALIRYCESFGSGPIDSKLKGIPRLNSITHKKFGACEVRSLVFKCIADQIGIKSEVVKNKCHDMVEVSYVESEKHAPSHEERYLIDLDGFPAQLKTIRSFPVPVKPPETFANYFDRVVKEFKQKPANKHNLLLTCNSSARTLNFHKEMLHYAAQRTKRYFYIDDLSSISFLNAKVGDDKQLQRYLSALAEFLRNAQPGDVLAVNWSEFQSCHIGHNSIMDTIRRLGNVSIPEGVIVVGVLNTNACQLSGDFYSRFPVHSPYPAVIKDEPKLPAKEQPAKSVYSIPLYGGDKWKSDLKGTMRPHGHCFEHIKGQLKAAWEAKADEIHLVDVPRNDREWDIFLLELQERHEFDDNGEKYQFPSHVRIVTEQAEYKFADNFKVETLNAINSHEWEYVLNADTYSQFFEQSHSEKGYYDAAPGLLKHAATHLHNTPMKVLVTSKLKEGQMARLLAKAQEEKISLDFITANVDLLPEQMQPKKMEAKKHEAPPSSAISSNTPSTLPAAVLSKHTDEHKSAVSLVYTDNIKASASRFAKGVPHRIVINKQMEYGDVWQRCESKGMDDKGILLDTKLGDILKWLQAGEDVLLEGRFSDSLAAKMETLFAHEPHLWVNGEKQTFKGHLTIVTDQAARFAAAREALQEKQAEKVEDKQAAQKTYEPPSKLSEDLLEQRLQTILSILDHSPCVNLLGPSGTGKTTLVLSELPHFYKLAKQQEMKLFVGLDQIENWANENKSDQASVLFIDEANLERNGNLEMLEGIFGEPPGLLIRGKYYALGPQQKVIFAGNSSQYVGRQKHDILEKAPTMLFPEWPEAYLAKRFIEPGLAEAIPGITDEQKTILCNAFLVAHREMKAANELFSIRDLHAMCLRAALLLPKCRGLFQNNVGELGAFIAKEALKERRGVALAKTPDPSLRYRDVLEKEAVTDFKAKEFVMAPSRNESIRILTDHLKIRTLRINAKQETDKAHKKEEKRKLVNLESMGPHGIYLEGPSGIGKSALLRELLVSHDFVEATFGVAETKQVAEAKSQGKCFYHITPTDPDVMLRTLHQAFHEGALVIIDELNSLPIEKALNAFLSGVDQQGQEAKRAGFTVFATGNPPNFRGRLPLSPALKNRLQLMHLDDYPDPELESILCGKGLSSTEAQILIKDHDRKKQGSVVPVPLRCLFDRADEVMHHKREEKQAASTASESNNRSFQGSSPSPAFFQPSSTTSTISSVNIARTSQCVVM